MAAKSSRTEPNGVITGIPRSGTSYLCSLLHGLDGHVAINEPLEVFGHLQSDLPDHGIADYYVKLRKQILSGLPVENKTHNGAVITDTAKINVRTAAPIRVERPDFMLWTKNTLAYLGTLERLLAAMPDALFVACIRHPVDTIASWTRTFTHLRDADVERFPVGHPNDPMLSPAQRNQLTAIAACSDLSRRRAMLWNYLAGVILKHQNRLTIMRLEDLADDPATTLRRLSIAGSIHEALEPRVRNKKRAKTRAADLDVILVECGANASQLGYSMEE